MDSRASSRFLAKKFVQMNNLPVRNVHGKTVGGNGLKMADREGLANITVESGTFKVDLVVEVLDLPESRDLVIGLPDFPKFGFRLEDVLRKKPHVDITNEGEYDENIDQDPIVD